MKTAGIDMIILRMPSRFKFTDIKNYQPVKVGTRNVAQMKQMQIILPQIDQI